MDPLSRSLRAAVETAPPTRIDLDDLIRRGYRERGRHRAAWAVAGAAATVAAVTTGAMLLGPGGPTSAQQPGTTPDELCATARPTPSSSRDATFDEIPPGTAPVPTEPEADAVARLSAALTDTLAANLPGRTVTDRTHPGCTRIQVEPKLYPARYSASANIDGTDTYLVVMISEKDHPGIDFYPQKQTLPDGTVVGYMDADEYGLPADGWAGQVGARRPDGTTVTVILVGTGGATQEEALAIAADPRLTLYP